MSISVDAEFVAKQKKVLSLFAYIIQVYPEAEWYKIGKEYDVQANIDKYSVSFSFCDVQTNNFNIFYEN